MSTSRDDSLADENSREIRETAHPSESIYRCMIEPTNQHCWHPDSAPTQRDAIERPDFFFVCCYCGRQKGTLHGSHVP